MTVQDGIAGAWYLHLRRLQPSYGEADSWTKIGTIFGVAVLFGISGGDSL